MRPWAFDPTSYELQTVAIVCLNTVLFITCQRCYIMCWYNLVLMDPLNTIVPVCSPFTYHTLVFHFYMVRTYDIGRGETVVWGMFIIVGKIGHIVSIVDIGCEVTKFITNMAN